MKTKILFILLFVCCLKTIAQTNETIAVNYDKTVHMIFKSRILYIDLGSESIMASTIDNLPNVLRLKAAERDFKDETNISVILEDNTLYNFNVIYLDTLSRITYYPDNIKSENRENYSKTIYDLDEYRIHNIGYIKYGIRLIIKGIFITDEGLYIHLDIKNTTDITFSLDNTTFSIETRHNKLSSNDLAILDSYYDSMKIAANQSKRFVYMLPRFILQNNQLLRIVISEKSGSRNLDFCIDGKLLSKSIDRL